MDDDAVVPGGRVADILEPEVRSHLRSVVGYTPQSYTIQYIRDDVADHYTTAEIEAVIEELRLKTIEQSHAGDIYGSIHGDVECCITVFEQAIDLNFVLAEGTGVEVAFDRAWADDQLTVVETIQDTLASDAQASPTNTENA